MNDTEMTTYEATLTALEKQTRSRFVNEYLYDQDARSAAKRLGYAGETAKVIAYEFMECPFVQKLIAEKQRGVAEDPKLEGDETKRLIRAALLREANYRGPGSSHAARVSALSKLATMYDMDAALKIKSEVKNMGGVMQVPEIGTAEDWQARAMVNQQSLQDAIE